MVCGLRLAWLAWSVVGFGRFGASSVVVMVRRGVAGVTLLKEFPVGLVDGSEIAIVE